MNRGGVIIGELEHFCNKRIQKLIERQCFGPLIISLQVQKQMQSPYQNKIECCKDEGLRFSSGDLCWVFPKMAEVGQQSDYQFLAHKKC